MATTTETVTTTGGTGDSQSNSITARTVKVSNLSAKTSERDIREFFTFCGDIEQINIRNDSNGDDSKVAYVTFKDVHALDTAVLLSGATIVNQVVTITEIDSYPADYNVKQSTEPNEATPVMNAVFKVQDVMTSMIAKGYVLGKDALEKAKTFDEEHQITANATATVSSIDSKLGVSQTVSTGAAVVNEHVRAIDQKFQVSEKTRQVFSAAEEKVGAASSALLNNKYIYVGATWVTGALSKVTKAAGEVSQKAFGETSNSK